MGGGGVARPREAAAVGGCPWAKTGLGGELKDAVCPWANSLPSLSLTLLFWEPEWQGDSSPSLPHREYCRNEITSFRNAS